jgi:hypothetical protein
MLISKKPNLDYRDNVSEYAIRLAYRIRITIPLSLSISLLPSVLLYPAGWSGSPAHRSNGE